MEASDEMPKTAQPSVYEAHSLYQKLSKDYDEILSIHLGSNFSGAVQTLKLIEQEITSAKVTVYDTKLISVLAGYMVLEAKRLVDEGRTVAEVVTHLDDIRNKPVTYATLNSLDYLVQGGRIHSVVGSLARWSKVKPIIKVAEDGVAVIDAIRTQKRALNKLEALVGESIEDLDAPFKLTVVHGNVPQQAEKVRSRMEACYPNQEIELESLTSVIGVHTGPEVIGIMITPDYS